MKERFDLAVLLFILSCATLSGAVAEPSGNGGFIFEDVAPTFGVITHLGQGGPTLTVRAKYAGKADVSIVRAVMGCGCMQAIFAPGTFSGGAVIRVTVQLDQKQIQRGRHSYPLSLCRADGAVVASVDVSYDYEPDIYTEQRELHLDYESENPHTTVPLTVRDPGIRSSLRIEGLPPFLRADFESRDSLGLVELTISGSIEHPFVAQRRPINIFSGDRREPDLTLYLSSNFRPNLGVEPSVLLLGVIPPEGVARTVRVTAGDRFRIGSVTSSNSMVQITDASTDSVRAYRVSVVPPRDSKISILEAKVTITVAEPNSFQVEIPVVGEINGSKD